MRRLMKNEDVKLIHRILSGDETAFVSLVNKYKKQVHTLAWRKIGDFHIAEEITQDTFLKVYQKLYTLKNPNQFSGWLYVIATNQCRAWLRKKRIETESLDDTETEWIDTSAYSRYVAEEQAKVNVETQREVVKKLLAKLKESERTVITLHYFGEMTIEEISRFLGVSASAIKLRLHRARQRLQKEEPMIREAISNFQLSPILTDNILQKVEHLKPAAPSSGSKPFIPWVIGASSIALIVLMLGIGSQYLAHFQQPYSLDSHSELAVELIDAPIMLNLDAKPVNRNQLGSQADDIGNSDGSEQESNQVLSDEGDYTQMKLPKEAKARLGKGRVTSNIAYSPDGTLMAVASVLGIWIYDARTRKVLDVYNSHGLVGNWGADRELRKVTRSHRGWPTILSFSPDSKTLASANGTIILWDIPTGQQKAVLTPLLNEAGVMDLSFSPDGKTLVSCHRDNTIRLFNVTTTEQEATLTGHSGAVGFSPDGKSLATAGDGGLLIWNVTTRNIDKRIYIGPEVYDEEPGGGKIYKDPAVVFSLCFSSDGKTLATGHKDTTVRLWDIETRTAKTTFKGHTDFVVSVCFSPDGKTLVSGSYDKTIRIWDVKTGEHKVTLKGHPALIKNVTYSNDGNTIASQCLGEARFWNATTGEHKATLLDHTIYINTIAYSPDGTTIASGYSDGVIRLWDTSLIKHKKTLVGHTKAIRSISFSPDGKTLISGGDDNQLRLWDVDTEKQIKTFTGHTNKVTSVTLNVNRRILASVSDSEIWLWDVSTGKHLSTLTEHTRMVSTVVFSLDGKTLASADISTDRKNLAFNTNNSVILWDVETGQQKSKFNVHSKGIYDLSFSPEGDIIAIAGKDDTLYLWNYIIGNHKTIKVNTPILITNPRQSGKTFTSPDVFSVSFSPDGKTLVTGHEDSTLRVWDASTGQQTAILIGHLSHVESVHFSPDGHTIASLDRYGAVFLWDLTSLTNTN